jgi:hypothetical protein
MALVPREREAHIDATTAGGSSVTRAITTVKPKGAKGTGKAKKPAAAKKAPGVGAYVPAGTMMNFVDGAFIGGHAHSSAKAAAPPKKKKTATKKPVAVKTKHAAPAPRPKKPKADRQLTTSAVGPGVVRGITCNGKEIFTEIVFELSFSVADGCIRVDGHVVHNYKPTDKIALGTMQAAGLLGLH